MRGTTVGRTYAEALFELASTDDAVEAYGTYIQQLVDLIETERDFRLFLDTPSIEPAAKKQLIHQVFGDVFPQRLLRFIFVVIDRRRQRALPVIAQEYAELLDEHFDRLQVRVTLPGEPDEEFEEELRGRLGRLFEKEVHPHYRIDPRILGGVVIRVGDRVMDGSLRRRLQLLRRRLLRADAG